MEKFNPVSTYRIQFNKNFGLKELKKSIHYLDKPGFGCIYTLPILQAATGSLHGYDVTDPTRINDAFTASPFPVMQDIPNKPHRQAGILMHISSLPGAYGTGDFGPEAKKFVDFLEKSGQRYWQVLPLNVLDRQTSYSPYSSLSAFAGSHLFIDPYRLKEMGLIARGETDRKKIKGKRRASYSKAAKAKTYYIDLAYKKFSRGENAALMEEYAIFLEREKFWLDDFALFICLKEEFKEQPWSSWPEAYRHRDKETLAQFASLNEQRLDMISFTQFLFSRQWQELKGYANDRGIEIFGDIPIYIDFDSADVWANPGLFQLNEAGEMTGVAGVPPDYFNEDGQHWGMPLFNWEAMKKFFESTGTFLRPQKPSPQHWTNFAVGRSYFHFSATMSVRDNFIRIELIIDGNEAKNNFFQLKNKYEEEANNLFDNQLIWEELPDAKVSSIYIKKSANTSARSEWQEQHEWFRENLEKMDKFFRPKIKEL